MQERTCGDCALWLTDSPAAFEGACRYFPPQLARMLGVLTNVRPITTRDDGCHIGYRPREVRPAPVPLDEAAVAGIRDAARQGGDR